MLSRRAPMREKDSMFTDEGEGGGGERFNSLVRRMWIMTGIMPRKILSVGLVLWNEYYKGSTYRDRRRTAFLLPVGELRFRNSWCFQGWGSTVEGRTGLRRFLLLIRRINRYFE